MNESSQSLGTSYDPALQPLVSIAVEDLAQRLGIEPQQIEVLEAKSVVWSDPSMGCPQPGMNYIQVPQDGVFIQLSAEGQIYDYHGGGTTEPFLCEQTFQIEKKPTPIDIVPPADSIDQ